MSDINYEQVNLANLEIINNYRLDFWTKIIETEDTHDLEILISDSSCPKCSKFIDSNVKICPHCECEFNSKTVKEFKRFTEPGRGKKKCPGCDFYVAVRTHNCICGYDFKNKILREPKEQENKYNNIKRRKPEKFPIGQILDLDLLIKNDIININYISLLEEEVVRKNPELYNIGKKYVDKVQKVLVFNQDLIYSIANKIGRKYKLTHLSINDLAQDGMIGCMKAIYHFSSEVKTEEDKCIAFSTYATWWITKSIIDSINDCEKIIRIPTHIINDYKMFRKYLLNFKDEKGCDPSIEDIMDDLCIKKKKAEGLLFAYCYNSNYALVDDINKFSDSSANESKKLARMNLKFDSGSLSTYDLTSSLDEETLTIRNIDWDRIKFKNDTYRQIFYNMKGLFGYEESTLGELEEKYGITKMTIMKIERDTIERIRKQLGVKYDIQS